jgi:hypothetical protein
MVAAFFDRHYIPACTPRVLERLSAHAAFVAKFSRAAIRAQQQTHILCIGVKIHILKRQQSREGEIKNLLIRVLLHIATSPGINSGLILSGQ